MPDQPAPDFEQARRIAEDMLGDEAWVANYPASARVARAYLALLSEREAREEVIKRACNQLSGNIPREQVAGFLLKNLALPATESAQGKP